MAFLHAPDSGCRIGVGLLRRGRHIPQCRNLPNSQRRIRSARCMPSTNFILTAAKRFWWASRTSAAASSAKPQPAYECRRLSVGGIVLPSRDVGSRTPAASVAPYNRAPRARATTGAMSRRPQCLRGMAAVSAKTSGRSCASAGGGPPSCLSRRCPGLGKPSQSANLALFLCSYSVVVVVDLVVVPPESWVLVVE
jgi:hypothetical protein